jgi:hypothetical protein
VADRWFDNHRRYCFLRMKAALRIQDDNEAVWDAKRRIISGTSIPTGFPARTQLLVAGYLVTEELDGSDTTELTTAGLTSQQAAAVLAAIG